MKRRTFLKSSLFMTAGLGFDTYAKEGAWEIVSKQKSRMLS